MNIVGRTAGLVKWLLFGNDSPVIKNKVLTIANWIRDGAEIQVTSDGVFIRWKKEF
jgi:hypothetical protein